MTEIRLPQYGMGMTDGTIVKWHVTVGQTIQVGQPLCEVEAAKTNVEFDSPLAGTVVEILVALDQNVPVNTALLIIDESGASTTASQTSPVAEVASPEPDESAEAPSASEAVKATPLAKRVAEQAGVDLASIQGSGGHGRIRRDDVIASAPAPLIESSVQIEPRARKAARDRGIDLADVTGSGPNGRIVSEDVERHADAKATPAPTPSPTAAPRDGSNAAEPAGGFTEIKHSMMRRTIARRLTESKQTVPHFYLKASCQIDALLAARKAINSEGHERVSVNDLVIRS